MKLKKKQTMDEKCNDVYESVAKEKGDAVTMYGLTAAGIGLTLRGLYKTK